jgi:hypothetical protein
LSEGDEDDDKWRDDDDAHEKGYEADIVSRYKKKILD